mgnify:CR=1 FL=1|jgi:hypothetical protein
MLIQQVIAIMVNKDKSRLIDVTEGSNHYHTNQVAPKWKRSMTKVMSINNHIYFLQMVK